MKIYLVAASMSLLLAAQVSLARGAPDVETETVLVTKEQEQSMLLQEQAVSLAYAMCPAPLVLEEHVRCVAIVPDPRNTRVRTWRDRHTGARYQVRGLINRKRPRYLRQKRPG